MKHESIEEFLARGGKVTVCDELTVESLIKEKRKDYHRKKYQENKMNRVALATLWNMRNPEKHLEGIRKYQKKNKERQRGWVNKAHRKIYYTNEFGAEHVETAEIVHQTKKFLKELENEQQIKRRDTERSCNGHAGES